MASPLEFVTAVVRRLVDKPDALTTRWMEAEKTVEIDAPKGERGKVIGRRGKTIDALRILVNAVFASNGERIDVKLREE